MLELALDRAFVDNFHTAFIESDEYADDFYKYFIRNLQKFKLITNYADIEDLMQEAKDNPLLELIIERIPVIEYDQNFDVLIDSPGFPQNGSPIKLILSGDNNTQCINRRKRFGLEYLNPSNLKDRWPLYFSRRTDINKKTTNDPEIPDDFRFDSWDCIKPFAHPINAIIIVDFYLLCWEREDELINNIKNNIAPLLEVLLLEASTEVPINITFISEFKDKPPKKQVERVKTSRQQIEAAIGKITSRPFNLNILVHNKRNYTTDFQEFHDRIIITNYFYINCGAGFNIGSRKAGVGVFDKPGKINKIRHNSEIQFRSILNIQNYWTAFKDLKQLDIYCKRLENHPGLPDYVNFLPDKINRLLGIEHN